jgi:hypothetical protein
MSLDVYLEDGGPMPKGSGIFIRENGSTREISREEWDAKFPGTEPVVADVECDYLYSDNITHNLGKMANAAGIYQHLWRPEEIGIERAEQLIEPLTEGLNRLRSDPAFYRTFNSPNGWGLYEHFVPFVSRYLDACKANPHAIVHVSR